MWIFLPYQVDVPMERVPWANWVLITITCLLSLAGMVSAWESGADAWLRNWCLQRENFHWYQLLTYQFVHAGFLHLATNMYFLFLFGNAVNAKLGHVRYLVCYLGLGVLAGLVWLVSADGDLTLGASGAICGITGMFLVFYPFNDVAVFYGWYFLYGDMGITYWSAIWLIGLYLFLDLLGAFLWYYEAVAYTAHLGGYVFGISAALILLLGRWVKPAKGEQNLLQYLGLGEAVQRRPRKKKRSLVRRQSASQGDDEQGSASSSGLDTDRYPRRIPPGADWANWGD